MKFLILGGDKRILFLKEMLSKKHSVEDSFLTHEHKIKDINDFDIIILPVPFTRRNHLNTDLYKKEVPLYNLLRILDGFKGKIIGGFNKNDLEALSNFDTLNILKDEEFTLINSIITSEGAIETLINENTKSLFESRACILGYGRLGRALSRRLSPLCKDMIVYNNKSLNYINAKMDSILCKPLYEFKDDAKDFDIIINTIPSLICDKSIINTLKLDSLILDLSSLPGGFDFNELKNRKIKYIHYLGVPGKVSPYSAGKSIYDFIEKNI